MPSTPLNATQRHLLAWSAVAAALVVVAWLLGPVLTPFLTAMILAYMLAPVVQGLEARRVPRVLAVVLAELILLAFGLLLVLLVVPILWRELPNLNAQIPLLVDRLNALLAWIRTHLGWQVPLDVGALKAMALDYFSANAQESLTSLLSSARIGGSAALAVLGTLILVPVVLFYVLQDWNALGPRLEALIPPRFRAQVLSFLKECDLTLGQYFRGQALVMVVLSAYYASALALGGFDLALPVGLLTGLAIFVPYVGFGLGLVLALLAALLQFGDLSGVLIVALIYGLGQVLESFVLTPRLVGERIGLSPLAVIFALLAFGHLLGFVGVLLALPASAVAVVALRRLRRLYLNSKLYQG